MSHPTNGFTYSPASFHETLAPLSSKPRFNSEKCGGHSWFRINTMPRNRYSSRAKLDIDAFDLQVLDAPDGLATALHAFEAACHRGDSEIAEMVESLMSRSYLLEYLISSTLHVLDIGPCTSSVKRPADH